MAYQNIYAKDGNMTPGSDGTTIDGMSLERIDRIIASIKDHSYQPKPAKRTYIKKKNGKLHPLGIPSSNDKIVQDVVRLILESNASVVKSDIKQFLSEVLKLTMSDEKTKITHCKDKARFLGYDITTMKHPALRRNKIGNVVRVGAGMIALYVPYEKWRDKLLDYKAMQIKVVDGIEKWKPLHRGFLVNAPNIAIIQKYNSEIRGLYNYYRLAHNASVIGKFAYIMEYSMYKTFAGKYNKTTKYIIEKYSKNGEFKIPYDTKDGEKYCVFYNEGFVRKEIPLKGEIDTLPRFVKRYKILEQVRRLTSGVCELCGKENIAVYMHHVRKLKDLKGNSEWVELMRKKHRKSLAVCNDCHELIHENI